MKKYYLAYGSNLNLDQMKYRCPHAVPIGSDHIMDYELVFRGVATIEPKKGAEVPVGVWEITDEDERTLDRYEGFPYLYRKETFQVQINGKKEDAMIYIMNSERRKKAYPASSYLMTIAKGYQDFGFDVRPLVLASVTK